MKANENPFRSSNVERVRYALDQATLNQLAETALAWRQCCLLGPHGTGKTTLLEDLEPLLQERGVSTNWIHLNLDSSKDERRSALTSVSQLPAASVCLFDGAEVLSHWQQFRLRRIARQRGRGLIVTLHRKSPLPVLHQTQPDWQMAEQLVRQLAAGHCNEDLIQ